MTETLLFTDPMPAIRAWAAQEPHITAINAGRVYGLTPDDFQQSPPATWLTAVLIDLEEDEGDGPFVYPHVQFGCNVSDAGDDAGRLRAAVVTAVHAFSAPFATTETIIHGAELLPGGGGFSVDEQSQRPRYDVTVRFLTRAA